jgi:hypothetical protein
MPGFLNTSVVQEPVVSVVVILLGSALGLLVALLALLVGISRCLTRMERHLAASASRDDADSSSAEVAEISAGGAFETFLNEEAARRLLPKNEQFAAYRRWRQENGLNWSNP